MSSVSVSEDVGSSIVLVLVIVLDFHLSRFSIQAVASRIKSNTIEERRIGMESTAFWATKSGCKPGD
jgi:hypothetical protein